MLQAKAQTLVCLRDAVAALHLPGCESEAVKRKEKDNFDNPLNQDKAKKKQFVRSDTPDEGVADVYRRSVYWNAPTGIHNNQRGQHAVNQVHASLRAATMRPVHAGQTGMTWLGAYLLFEVGGGRIDVEFEGQGEGTPTPFNTAKAAGTHPRLPQLVLSPRLVLERELPS